MKQLFVIFLIGALFMGSKSYAQKGEPHLVRKNADRSIVYTQAELADSLNQSGAYYESLRNEMFKAIKIGYDKKGKVFPVTNFNSSDNVNFVFSHTKYVEKSEFEDNIQNGYKIGNSANNYVTVQKKEGYYGVFEHDGVSVRFIDPNCGNIQKEFGSKISPPVVTDSSYTYVADNGQPTTILFSPNITVTGGTATASITNSGNSENNITNTEEVVEDAPRAGRIVSVPVDDNNIYPTRGYYGGNRQSYSRVSVRGRIRIGGNQQRPQQQYRQQRPRQTQQVVNHASGTGGFKEGNQVYRASGTRGRRS